jgi:hypothetical protein
VVTVAILVGIDEAGYGPVLGPLVVTGVAFEVPDADPTGCLWTRLQRSVTRSVSRRDLRLPVVDSKKLYHRQSGLAALERTALTAMRVGGHTPASLRDLLELFCPHVVDQLDPNPWYRYFDIDLPTTVDAADVATRANALSLDCRDRGVQLLGICSEPLLEGHYNRLVNNTRNKAVVLLGLVLRIIDRVRVLAGGRKLYVCVDRHGGRSHYGPQLMTAFDGYALQIEEESAERSAYVMQREAVSLHVEFAKEGEDRHLPVALASILSKYVRELFMLGLNRYWQRRVEGLRPTAGYYTDGKRFLADIEGELDTVGVDRRLLERSR